MNIKTIPSKLFSSTALSAMVLGAALMASATASAQNISLNIGGMVAPGVYGSVSVGQPIPVHSRHHHNLHNHYVPPRVMYPAPPVYYQQPPVVYQQPPVYYQRPPVYYQQPQVIVRPPVVVAPRHYGNAGYGHGYRGHAYRGHHHRGHY